MVLKAGSLSGKTEQSGIHEGGESRTDAEGKCYFHTFSKEELEAKYGKPKATEEEKVEEKVDKPKPKKKKGRFGRR